MAKTGEFYGATHGSSFYMIAPLAHMTAVFVAGGTGCLFRYWVNQAVQPWARDAPWGTLICNAAGSFGLALIATWVAMKHPWPDTVTTAITVGLFGGFTTYSTYNLELLRMVQDHRWANVLAYGAGTTVTCLLFGAAGMWLARSLAPVT